MYKNKSFSKSFFKDFKSTLGISIKINNITNYFSNKLSKKNYYFKEPKKKISIKVSKINKSLYILNSSKVFLAYNSLNFIRVYL